MHHPINGARVAQVAAKIGYPPVTLADFKSAGYMRATAKGLAVVQSEEFACMLHALLHQLESEGKDADEVGSVLLTFAAMHICVDECNCVAGEPSTVAKFINANTQPLARLLQPALVICDPDALKEMGL